MTTERDPRTRIVLLFLREETHENPERVLLRALDEVDTTPQRRAWWPGWRTNRRSSYANLIVAAAAVLVVSVVGYQLLPRNGGIGGQPTASPSTSPTTAPSPSPALLASGTFLAKGARVELIATGTGDSVTGTMTVGDEADGFTVDLTCARLAGDGRILIGGNTTDSNSVWTTKGTHTAIVLKPGSPVRAVFGFKEDAPLAASCMAYLDAIINQHFATAVGDGALEPITGTVDLVATSASPSESSSAR